MVCKRLRPSRIAEILDVSETDGVAPANFCRRVQMQKVAAVCATREGDHFLHRVGISRCQHLILHMNRRTQQISPARLVERIARNVNVVVPEVGAVPGGFAKVFDGVAHGHGLTAEQLVFEHFNAGDAQIRWRGGDHAGCRTRVVIGPRAFKNDFQRRL